MLMQNPMVPHWVSLVTVVLGAYNLANVGQDAIAAYKSVKEAQVLETKNGSVSDESN